ncbi:hypothetical protein FXF51_01820 [Nonomuraea sp. PA05]|uniref:hypothetical protein n=1 Tax=Nonomuraea sp. PA05 TaxID=2604466 RepID=UPI0011DAD1C1|nr:hypothetical protein [Nonomuraea sp. PA05]TYB71199.1 hypothetical protein FXF51_01820 [Nonomuraea sp. PA05]
MSARNDHTPDPIGHSDPEAAAALSDETRKLIVETAAADPTLTPDQIAETLDTDDEEVTPGAVTSVLLSAAIEQAGHALDDLSDVKAGAEQVLRSTTMTGHNDHSHNDHPVESTVTPDHEAAAALDDTTCELILDAYGDDSSRTPAAISQILTDEYGTSVTPEAVEAVLRPAGPVAEVVHSVE